MDTATEGVTHKARESHSQRERERERERERGVREARGMQTDCQAD